MVESIVEAGSRAGQRVACGLQDEARAWTWWRSGGCGRQAGFGVVQVVRRSGAQAIVLMGIVAAGQAGVVQRVPRGSERRGSFVRDIAGVGACGSPRHLASYSLS